MNSSQDSWSVRIRTVVAVSLAAFLFNQTVLFGGEFPDVIDATTLEAKVLCGYQGWFRCPGDKSKLGWVHWSRNSDKITKNSLTVEMWPDMSELSDDERFSVAGFHHADGRPASLFSSVHPKTVHRHFQWMRDYGVQGVWLQRFVVGLTGARGNTRNAANQKVVDNVRRSAKETGRVWAITYDMTDMPNDRLFDEMIGDWKRLVDSGLTRDSRYLHHNGKPVLMIWGFYSDRLSPELAARIVKAFRNNTGYGVYLVGGCDWRWREESKPAWSAVFRSFDAISPWNVGNFSLAIDESSWATTDYWVDDAAEARRFGMRYIPVLWPGFSWDNLKRLEPGSSNTPRRQGEFYWRQFAKVAEMKLSTAYVAMFDEVDEGTAIFKVSNTPPTGVHFLTLEGLPTDWYLRLTGAGTQMILGNRPYSGKIPLEKPSVERRSP
jgi:hypothetical protein